MQTDAFLMLDVHGKSAYQAKVAVDATLRRAGGAYEVRVIHGYNAGSAIRDMLRREYGSHPRVLSLEPGDNMGQTRLLLRRL
ncbi:MAG: Smr/MutS family protein [Clostridia bacterium]|nr:Smr/MutS family protein [Clostridia bacterium]